MCTLLEGVTIGQAGLSVEADVGQLVALVAGVGRDGLQRGGELHRPQARLSVNIAAQLRHALGDDGLSQVVATIECGLAYLLHRGGQHDGVQVIVLAESVVGQYLQVVGQFNVAQVVVVFELPVDEAGVQCLAHVNLDEAGAAVAQRDEVGIVQLTLYLDALQVDKVEVVAQLAEDFVAEGAGLLYGDVKHLVALAVVLILNGDKAVEGFVVGVAADGRPSGCTDGIVEELAVIGTAVLCGHRGAFREVGDAPVVHDDFRVAVVVSFLNAEGKLSVGDSHHDAVQIDEGMVRK